MATQRVENGERPVTTSVYVTTFLLTTRQRSLGFLVRPEGWTTSPFTDETRVCSLLYARFSSFLFAVAR